MIHRCTTRMVAPGGGPLASGNGPTMDLHCHWQSKAVMAKMHAEADRLGKVSLSIGSDLTREVNRRQLEAIKPKMESVDVRIADMDRMGVEIQAMSVFPPQMYYWADQAVAEEVFREINEDMAATVATRPDRLMGFGNVPLQDTELAVKELRYCHDELGFKGIQVACRVEDEELSAPRLEPFWDEVERLGMVVFVHSSGHSHTERLSDHYFINIIGHPIEGTLAASRLIFDGVMERHPNLKVVLAHGGGYLAAYSARMDHAYHAREDVSEGLPSQPSDYLRRFYLDTMVFAPDQLAYLIGKYGVDHIVLGTDYPYDMGEEDPIALISAAVEGDKAKIAAIAGGNARRLVGLA